MNNNNNVPLIEETAQRIRQDKSINGMLGHLVGLIGGGLLILSTMLLMFLGGYLAGSGDKPILMAACLIIGYIIGNICIYNMRRSS